MAEVSRTLLLFGSAVEFPTGFVPEAMNSGWFERAMGGLTLDEYVESIFLVSVLAQQHGGAFSLDWLDGPGWAEFHGLFSRAAVQQTFQDHLLSNVEAFKSSNRQFQGSLPAAQKKYAFNPLANKPFIEGVASTPIAPWVQAIVSKALPPSIYHSVLPTYGDAFTRDLGYVFQHYVGRQLSVVGGASNVYPEVKYGPRQRRIDSCDWFLDLPDVLVLVECKARQPIESLRVFGEDWLVSIEGSVNKGISQLNRSNRDFAQIAAECPDLDPSKPRIGIVVTLESFFMNQNYFVRELLEEATFPVGIASAEELERLVLLSADGLGAELELAAGASQSNRLNLNHAIQATSGTENPLLLRAWESIGLFDRAGAMAEQARSN